MLKGLKCSFLKKTNKYFYKFVLNNFCTEKEKEIPPTETSDIDNKIKMKKKIWTFKQITPNKNKNLIYKNSNENLPKKLDDAKDNKEIKNLKDENIPSNLNGKPFKDHFLSFSYKNNANYDQPMKSRGDGLFLSTKLKLVHYLDDRNINDFKKGISENDYDFYDAYRDVPEFLILGRSNVGKSSLINALFSQDIAKENKKPGKTQRLEFYLFGKEGKSKNWLPSKSIYSKLKTENITPSGIIIDAPGFGWIDGPVLLRRKFKYLIYTYLNYAVRLKQIIYLINGEYGMTDLDKQEIQFLNNFNKDIQLVFTKIDKFSNTDLIKYITEASHFTRDLKNVRTEILLTSSNTGFGIRNMRTHMYMDIKEIEESKRKKLIDLEETENKKIENEQLENSDNKSLAEIKLNTNL